jgi:flagellar basal body-associated protein FliL
MEKNQPVIEPNFDGEEMKLPTVSAHRTIEAQASNSVLSLPIIILLVLVLAGILGGFYFWYTLVMKEAALTEAPVTRPTAAENSEPESTTAEARTQTTDVISTSDELPAIKADLDSTHLEELDTEVPAIESELNAAIPTNP